LDEGAILVNTTPGTAACSVTLDAEAANAQIELAFLTETVDVCRDRNAAEREAVSARLETYPQMMKFGSDDWS